MIKHSFKAIKKHLNGDNYIQLLPSIGDTQDTLVFRYKTADGDIIFHFDAKHKDIVLKYFNDCEKDNLKVGELVSRVVFYSYNQL